MFRRRSRRDSQDAGRLAATAAADQAAVDAADLVEYGEFGDEDGEFEEDEEFERGEFDEYDEAELAGPAAGSRGRSQGGRGEASRADLGDPMTWTRVRDSDAVSQAVSGPTGPWDSSAGYPEAERIDFGSLLVPVRDGYDVQVFMSEEEGISIAVVQGDSGIQLQPFAAPRSSGLWGDVLPEIAEEVAKAGGQSTEQDGPFGTELLAKVSPQGGERRQPPQPLRFLGVDGPRWFLRGLIHGPAATSQKAARPFEEIFAGVVVVRGEHAEPPRKPLDIRLPDEAREVLAGQLEQQGPDLLNPFERGPEITETR